MCYYNFFLCICYALYVYPSGYYQPETGKTSCVATDPGYYTSATSLCSQVDCSAGDACAPVIYKQTNNKNKYEQTTHTHIHIHIHIVIAFFFLLISFFFFFFYLGYC